MAGAGAGAAEGLAALRDLRKALASEDELVAQHAIDAGAIEALLAVLQGTCVDSQMEAAWCITNIASGSSAHTEAALATAPCLVQLLRSSSPAVQEQCAWALGNMAGDNPDFRDRIRANGAALPIVQLLQSASPNVSCTAAWALCASPPSPHPLASLVLRRHPLPHRGRMCMRAAHGSTRAHTC